MPITYTFHPAYSLLVTRYTGDISDDETIAAYATIFADPALQPGFNELTDLREAETLNVSAEAMRVIAAMAGTFHRSALGGTLSAHLLTSNYQSAVSRMYEAYASFEETEELRTFTDAAEALEWLGAGDLPPEDIHTPGQTAGNPGGNLPE